MSQRSPLQIVVSLVTKPHQIKTGLKPISLQSPSHEMGRTGEGLGLVGEVHHAFSVHRHMFCPNSWFVPPDDRSCSTPIPFPTLRVQGKLWCPLALSLPYPFLVKPTRLRRGRALSPTALGPSCSYTKPYYGEQWT